MAQASVDADEAVTRLYAEHQLRLVRVATLLVGDSRLAEDLVQDAFVDLHGRWHKLRDHDKAAGYLRRSVVNRSRSALRHRAVVRRTPGDPLVDVASAEQAAMGGATRTAVLEALARLPRRQREVLAMRYYLDLSESQIADLLGIGNGSVKSHASRGADALRRELADWHDRGHHDKETR